MDFAFDQAILSNENKYEERMRTPRQDLMWKP